MMELSSDTRFSFILTISKPYFNVCFFYKIIIAHVYTNEHVIGKPYEGL